MFLGALCFLEQWLQEKIALSDETQYACAFVLDALKARW
jgi:hypothetical protein